MLQSLVLFIAALAVCVSAEPTLHAARRALQRTVSPTRHIAPRWIDQPADCVGCAARLNESACVESCSCGWCHASPGVAAHCMDTDRGNEDEQWRPATCAGAWDTDAGSNDCRLFTLATVQALAATLGFAGGTLVLYVLVSCCFCCCCSKQQRRRFHMDDFDVIHASGGSFGAAMERRERLRGRKRSDT